VSNATLAIGIKIAIFVSNDILLRFACGRLAYTGRRVLQRVVRWNLPESKFASLYDQIAEIDAKIERILTFNCGFARIVGNITV
jgi:hypothetical protein